MRDVLNGILKLNRTGCQWRNLDKKYPPWASVYYYFRKWQRDGTWTQVIVNQSQEAILYKSGKALDLFGPGRHTLKTQNIPL